MKQIENIHLNLSTESLPGEIWVDIVNLNGKYQISNLGRLKSLYDCNDNRRDLIRAQGYDKNGYPRLALYDKRKNWAHLTKYLPDAPYTKVLSNPELHPKCILSKQKIIQIFKDIRKHKVIAVDYGVSLNYVTNIKLRRTWKTLTKSI